VGVITTNVLVPYATEELSEVIFVTASVDRSNRKPVNLILILLQLNSFNP
jgi:hypothetical protein